MSNYTVIRSLETQDVYESADVPGEFRSFTKLLGSEQLALSLIRIPPHSDFEQSTGHYHDDLEEIYIITQGKLTMRFNDDIITVAAGSAVRVAPQTQRSHRNEGDQPVEMWAVSQRTDKNDAHLIKEFWEASSAAKQHKENT
jgi:mannose-6-phosphate isomerase-like protein (cupin superfamily)